jgi:uncharacterized protein
MRLYAAKIPTIASEVVRTLVASKDIEAEAPREVESDVAAVLNNYLTVEREVNDRAKDMLDRTGRPQTEFQRMRQLVADQKGIKIGEDMLDYLLDQVVEIFHHSSNVDEIYCEDVELRRKMAPVFKRHMAVDSSVDLEVRAQLKHLKEGTTTWEVEYARVLDQVKRKHGLS